MTSGTTISDQHIVETLEILTNQFKSLESCSHREFTATKEALPLCNYQGKDCPFQTTTKQNCRWFWDAERILNGISNELLELQLCSDFTLNK
jgi:hypothetical protein